MDSSTPAIALYGATGFTGGLVARELAEAGMPFVASGRSLDKLDRLVEELGRDYDVAVVAKQADVGDEHSLDAMLEGVSVLINCAGPFSDIGPPVVEAAVRNGVHYFDTTGEQSFMKWVQRELSDRARGKQIALVPGCAYEYAVGNFAAKLATTLGARRLGICYSVSGMGMSHGTKKSIVRVLSAKGYTFVDGHLEARKPAYRLFDVPLPGGRNVKGAWFPGGESLTVPLFAQVSQVESCLAVGGATARLMKLASPVIDTIADTVGGLAERVIEMTSGDPHAQGEEASFVVSAFDPESSHFYAAVTGQDPYDVTASIIVEAARRTLASPPEEGGFTSAAALFDVRDFLATIGLKIVEG
jgi:hypothetical protein